MPTPTAFISRPNVLIAGQANQGLSLDAVSVLVEETIAGLYRCEARFNNFGYRDDGVATGYRYFGRNTLDFGTSLAIELGAGDRGGRVFQGRISGLEAEYPYDGGAQLIVLAEDRLQDLRLTRRTRSFEDVSDEDVIRQIASEHSLTPQLDLDGPTHKALAQVNQSDLAFIRERARAAGAELWLDDTTLHARSRTARDGGTVDLDYGSTLLSFSVRADLAHQCTEVGVSGWDVAAKEAIEETAEEAAISAELDGDTSGGSILQGAFAERRERVVHTVPLTSEEARGIAAARYRERARRFVTGAGVADGDARIRAGGQVNLTGLGGLFSGRYYVVRVRHTYDGLYGFRTEFDVERPGLGPA